MKGPCTTLVNSGRRNTLATFAHAPAWEDSRAGIAKTAESLDSLDVSQYTRETLFLRGQYMCTVRWNAVARGTYYWQTPWSKMAANKIKVASNGHFPKLQELLAAWV